MNGESWQTHTRNTLEDGSLYHDGPVILDGGHSCSGSLTDAASSDSGTKLHLVGLSVGMLVTADHVLPVGGCLGMEDTLIAKVGFVALVSNISYEIGPRYTVGTLDQVGMSDGSETLANVTGVRDITVG